MASCKDRHLKGFLGQDMWICGRIYWCWIMIMLKENQMSAMPNGQERPISYSLSVQQKLVIIQQLLQQLTPRLPLNVQESSQPLDQQLQNQTIHYYELLGNRFRKRTQASNLISKLRELNIESEGQGEQLEKDPPDETRYFNCKVRCFRCKRIGHYSSYCPEEFFCIYCLSFKHPVDRCPQKVVCFRCYEFGHVISDCREGEGSYCKTCKRKHRNKECYFLAKGMEQIKEIFDCEYLENDQKIICISCGEVGHLNCRWTSDMI